MLRNQFSDQFFSDALPVLEMVLFDNYDRHIDHVPALFNVEGSDQWGEQDSTMAGIKAAVEKVEGDDYTYDSPIQGFDKTYQHATYAIAVQFAKELVEDSRMGMIKKAYASLGLSMYQTKQIVCFNVFNNGFSDTGPDGSSLFNSSHSLIGGGSYGNRPSTDLALSVAGLREMEVDMWKQVNHRNINVMAVPKTLLVEPTNKHTAFELIKSQDRPDTANRAINTFYGENYDVVVSPFLTSTTAWFALADKATHNLKFFNRVAPNVRSWEDPDTEDAKTRIRCRFSVGYSDWIGSWGTSG